MFQIIPCKECGSETGTPIGKVSVDVVLKKSNWCEQCQNVNTKNMTIYFCSIKCFQKYGDAGKFNSLTFKEDY